MSAITRQMLFNALVEKGAMSIGLWQKLTPAPVAWRITASSDDVLTFATGGRMLARINKGGKPFEGRSKIFAGTRITVTKAANKTARWRFEFIYRDGTTLSVAGGTSQGGATAGSFLIPMPKPWVYSKEVREKFGINTNSLHVSSYPS